MKTITYWVCKITDDSECYNIRAKTRREAKALREEAWNPGSYDPPKKVTVNFIDTFDLVKECLGEGRGGWEY